MPKLQPKDLANMHDVAIYWQQCLDELDRDEEETLVASHMVGVVSNKNDEQWGGPEGHPAYSIIFELAASLELPPDFTGQRHERWECIRALVPVLEERYLADNEKR